MRFTDRIQKDCGAVHSSPISGLLFDNEAGRSDEGNDIYAYHQYEAVMDEMTPKEYSDRQLSYGELAELDEEFDTAFIVDEDCLDDWSDKGLGENARIAYIEDRRTGVISGPDEFDCPEQFRK